MINPKEVLAFPTPPGPKFAGDKGMTLAMYYAGQFMEGAKAASSKLGPKALAFRAREYGEALKVVRTTRP